jgi:hypothetical protein
MYEELGTNAKSLAQTPRALHAKRCVALVAALLGAGAAGVDRAHADATVWVDSTVLVRDPEFGKECPAEYITDTINLASSQQSFQRKYTAECGGYRGVLLLDGAWQSDGRFKLTAHSFADKNYCKSIVDCGWHVCSGGPEHIVESTYSAGGDEDDLTDWVVLQDIDGDWDVAHLETIVKATIWP